MTRAKHTTRRMPDSRDGRAYVLNPDVAFAVEVAIATGRPLLLRGEPGSGKSSLAAYIARQRKWRYYEHVVTSRTVAQDLLWTFDAVRRLADAQVLTAGESLSDVKYIEPGVLWWAFAPAQARRRGAVSESDCPNPAGDPDPDNHNRSARHAVVLIDEIDKADPDMPNGMLVPLGSSEFEVTNIRTRVRGAHGDGNEHLVVVTTNEERDLPPAFLRRCIVAWLPEPTQEHLVEVAAHHLRAYDGEPTDADRELAAALAVELFRARDEAEMAGVRKPSTAEYLDALQALRRLGVGIGDEYWDKLRGLTLVKAHGARG